MKPKARRIARHSRKGSFHPLSFSKTTFSEETLMIQDHMSALRKKHEALERKINEEETRPLPDTIRIHSLKKEKLRLKEELLD
ncbi:YdcH family protein [Sphingorhabdus sp. YGSMI21]|uniref:YdcH family protein n=1 Tax=Sphingorhabdus sp. YGSMI21 TaxID=2077182 RepID=UPI003204F460